MSDTYNRETLLYLLSHLDIRIGTDIVEVKRIEAILDRYGERFFQRVLSKERERILERVKPDRLAEVCASYWATKEAVSKVLRTGISKMGNPLGVPLNDIEICHEPSGAPLIRLYGKAKRVADRDGLVKLTISMSTEGEYAIASAVGMFIFNIVPIGTMYRNCNITLLKSKQT